MQTKTVCRQSLSQPPEPQAVSTAVLYRKHTMNSSRLIAILATSLALTAFGTAARADTLAEFSFPTMFTADQCDTNKDGMVSKAEFMAMMDKVWAMKTKEVKAKNDKMAASDFTALMGWFSRGEKNK
jgi:hypothetical protein